MIDSDMPIINSKILREKLQENSIRIIDVRRDQEYQQGHITNAVNLPLAKLLNDDSPESIQKIAQDLGISNDTPVVVYDDQALNLHQIYHLMTSYNLGTCYFHVCHHHHRIQLLQFHVDHKNLDNR